MTTAAPVIIQTAIVRILRLAPRHRLCSRRSSYSDLLWASPPLATATERKNRKLIERCRIWLFGPPREGWVGGGVFRSFPSLRFMQGI